MRSKPNYFEVVLFGVFVVVIVVVFVVFVDVVVIFGTVFVVLGNNFFTSTLDWDFLSDYCLKYLASTSHL